MKNVLFLIILSAIACNTEKRGTMRLASLKTTHPKLVASFCSELYPIKETNTHTIEYRPGKIDTIWQAEYVDCDTVIGKDRIVKVPYPVRIQSKDTVLINTITEKENTAKISELTQELTEYKADVNRLKKRTKDATYGGFLIGLIICGGVCIFVFSKIK